MKIYFVIQLFLLLHFLFLILANNKNNNNDQQLQQQGPRYFHIPLLEVQQNPIYLKTTTYNEIVVAFSDKGSDLKPDDYITHADGVRILNGGLSAFLKSGEKEAVVPIVDESDSKYNGQRLLGFVLVQLVSPRKISSRRGDVIFDLDEGGPPPSMKLGNIVIGQSGAKTTSDPDYQPPPHGGGPCITGKDCYYFNGTCDFGQCHCVMPYTGSYCQLDRPDFAAAAILAKRQKDNKLKREQQRAPLENNFRKKDDASSPSASPSQQTTHSPVFIVQQQNQNDKNVDIAKQIDEEMRLSREQKSSENHFDNNQEKVSDQGDQGEKNQINPQEGTGKKIKKKKKIAPKNKPYPEEESNSQESHSEKSPDKKNVHEWSKNDNNEENNANSQQKVVTVEDLYGSGKPYPEPYAAGKLPANILRERHRMRTNREVFVYSVRFRTGPLGIVFNNKVNNETLIESVVKGQQAEQSDIKEGDKLIALDHFNLTGTPPKVTLRVMSSLQWPRILVFETRYSGEDPKIAEQKVKARSFNISIVYPPTLVGEYPFRISEWTPLVNLKEPISETLLKDPKVGSNFCPIYRIKALEDPFGCQITETDNYDFTTDYQSIISSNGFVSDQVESTSPFLSILLQEAFTKKLKLDIRKLGIMKRGMCTFVEKAKLLASGQADLGLVVNTENELVDLPSARENTQDCNIPIGSLRLNDGQYTQLAAKSNDIWAVVLDQNENSLSPACENLLNLIEDIVDKWAHSVPRMTVQQILKTKPPDQSKIRGLSDEGGRVALNGENGWAFFDYHLAMFGPQEVPLGPLRLVMALPPFGCDPNAYTVRITDSVVAILRGGGCSFGIKVINAQKLGAKAVMIVNTDDMKTMRLMALPDEVPLINIPCIMVSRRIQYYLERQLKPFHPLDQHLIAIQPTGVFGDYEQKNTLVLPQRLDSLNSPVNDHRTGTTTELFNVLQGSTDKSATFVFGNEDHTLGNVLRHILISKQQTEFCGYSVPHPYEPKMHIRLQTSDVPATQILKSGLNDLEETANILDDHFIEALSSYKKSTKGTKSSR